MGEHVAPTTPAKKKRSNIFWNIVGVVGELLITFAIIVGLFSVWQLYWTTYQVSGQVSQTIASYEEEHQPSKRTLGEVRTDDPPAFDREVGDGEVYGIVHVPTWDWMKIPLAEGTTSYVLDQGWAGHYDMTTQPGGVGNFSVAGHRRTYGNNFRWIDRLTQGDKVVVEVDDRYLVYSMVSSEIIDATDPSTLDLAEQVELVLVSSGARADLGQAEVGLVIVDDALAALPAAADDELRRRLTEVKAQRLLDLGREDEAAEVIASMPAEVEDTEIVDIALYADADVDGKRSPLRGSGAALAEEYDCALLDLDGTAWSGDETIEHAAASVVEAREAGMASAFVTNNAMRTPQQVADKLNSMDFAATPDMIMTSAMDIAAIMAEELEAGSKVFVIGGAGLRLALEERGFVLVDSADDEPAAVVQGLDKKVDWALLSEGAFAIERGAAFFASNLDATLPIERGQALGNGSLVRAIQHATRKRPIAGGKPEPGIYRRASELVGAQNPIAVGDRLETDIMGAVAAGVPALHVLTGVHQARDVIRAPRGQRPSYLAIDMRGLLEAHPAPKHHRDGTWTCGVSQVAKATRSGVLTLDDVELTEPVTISIDSYRALAAAAWEYADGAGSPVTCPDITVVDNEDPAGIVSQPEPVAAPDEDDFYDVAADADKLPEPGASTPAFLPGEEELEELLERTADLDEQA